MNQIDIYGNICNNLMSLQRRSSEKSSEDIRNSNIYTFSKRDIKALIILDYLNVSYYVSVVNNSSII